MGRSKWSNHSSSLLLIFGQTFCRKILTSPRRPSFLYWSAQPQSCHSVTSIFRNWWIYLVIQNTSFKGRWFTTMAQPLSPLTSWVTQCLWQACLTWCSVKLVFRAAYPSQRYKQWKNGSSKHLVQLTCLSTFHKVKTLFHQNTVHKERHEVTYSHVNHLFFNYFCMKCCVSIPHIGFNFHIKGTSLKAPANQVRTKNFTQDKLFAFIWLEMA